MEEIRAIAIFEMLGRPAEHLKSTLSQYIEKLSKEEGVEVVSRDVHEPKRIEDAKQELFTTFAEVEIKFKNPAVLFKIVLLYLPSHLDIISPEEIKIKNFDLSSITAGVISKLHQYDEVAKGLLIERGIMQNQLRQREAALAAPQAEKEEIKEEKKAKKPRKLKDKTIK